MFTLTNERLMSDMVELIFLAVLKLLVTVSMGAKIRNRYNQVPHLTQDTNGKVAK